MIDHFEIKVVEFEKCREFYKASLAPLGIEMKWSDECAAGFGQVEEANVRFLIEKSKHTSPVSSHIAFVAKNKDQVAEFHQKAIHHQGVCYGKPGLREAYAPNYFAAFALDPDGNNVEAVVYL